MPRGDIPLGRKQDLESQYTFGLKQAPIRTRTATVNGDPLTSNNNNNARKQRNEKSNEEIDCTLLLTAQVRNFVDYKCTS